MRRWIWAIGLLGCDQEGSHGPSASDVCAHVFDAMSACLGPSTSVGTEDSLDECRESLEACTDDELETFMEYGDCIAEPECDFEGCAQVLVTSVSNECLGGGATTATATTRAAPTGTAPTETTGPTSNPGTTSTTAPGSGT
jgi:hypothetical protein